MIVESFLVEEDVVFLSRVRCGVGENSGEGYILHGFLGEAQRFWLLFHRFGVYFERSLCR